MNWNDCRLGDEIVLIFTKPHVITPLASPAPHFGGHIYHLRVSSIIEGEPRFRTRFGIDHGFSTFLESREMVGWGPENCSADRRRRLARLSHPKDSTPSRQRERARWAAIVAEDEREAEAYLTSLGVLPA